MCASFSEMSVDILKKVLRWQNSNTFNSLQNYPRLSCILSHKGGGRGGGVFSQFFNIETLRQTFLNYECFDRIY